jgi:hypothetical protein
LTFAAWVFLDSVFWASNRGDIIMFVWAAILVLEPLVYAALWYLNRVFITGQDVSFNYKILVGLLFVPLIIFLPTDLALQSFDITTCLAVEGPIALYYTYIIEIILSLSVIIFSIRQYKKILDWQQKKKILYMTFGTVIFLIAFASGNIIGSSTGNWTVAQYGLFGMPVFMGFLTYLIVEYKAFNIKLIATQALVVILIVLIGSQFAFQDSVISIVLTSITLVGVMIFGIFLVKSVKREVLATVYGTASISVPSFEKVTTLLTSVTSLYLGTTVIVALSKTYVYNISPVTTAKKAIIKSAFPSVIFLVDFLLPAPRAGRSFPSSNQVFVFCIHH